MENIEVLYSAKVRLTGQLESANQAGAMDLAERIENKILNVSSKIDKENLKLYGRNQSCLK